MKLKDIFNGIANIFKSKNEEDKQKDNNNYQINKYDPLNEKENEINFEKLKKISEHTQQTNYNYNNNNNNTNQNNTQYNSSSNQTQQNSKTLESIIENRPQIIKKNQQDETIRTVTIEELKNEINTIWDIVKIKENTQAEHIIKCTPSDKWITMDELRQSIKLQFNVEYTNEKSLYPYLKTLVDINLIKMNNIGKKRTWKKNIIIIENKIK